MDAQEGSDRRQHVRVTLSGQVHSSARLGDGVRVINLSLGGALVEHTERFALGEIRVLALRLGEVDVGLEARVVWSRVHSANRMPSGPPRVTLRSGLRFTDLSGEAETILRRWLAVLGSRPW